MDKKRRDTSFVSPILNKPPGEEPGVFSEGELQLWREYLALYPEENTPEVQRVLAEIEALLEQRSQLLSSPDPNVVFDPKAAYQAATTRPDTHRAWNATDQASYAAAVDASMAKFAQAGKPGEYLVFGSPEGSFSEASEMEEQSPEKSVRRHRRR